METTEVCVIAHSDDDELTDQLSDHAKAIAFYYGSTLVLESVNVLRIITSGSSSADQTAAYISVGYDRIDSEDPSAVDAFVSEYQAVHDSAVYNDGQDESRPNAGTYLDFVTQKLNDNTFPGDVSKTVVLVVGDRRIISELEHMLEPEMSETPDIKPLTGITFTKDGDNVIYQFRTGTETYKGNLLSSLQRQS